MKIIYDKNNKKILRFRYYDVVEKSESYFAIYDNSGVLISHKKKWKHATKLAKLLDDAHQSGYSQGYYDGGEW